VNRNFSFERKKFKKSNSKSMSRGTSQGESLRPKRGFEVEEEGRKEGRLWWKETKSIQKLFNWKLSGKGFGVEKSGTFMFGQIKMTKSDLPIVTIQVA